MLKKQIVPGGLRAQWFLGVNYYGMCLQKFVLQPTAGDYTRKGAA